MTSVVSVTLSMMLAYACGLRALALTVVGLLGFVPAQFVVTFVTLRLFPLELELARDVRAIIYDRDDHTPSDRADGQATPARPIQTGAGAAADAKGRPGFLPRIFELFKDLNRPASFEGYLMQGMALIVAGSVLWFAAVPALQTMFPGLMATRTGPQGFPVTVYIGAYALSITNRTEGDWTCDAELGVRHLRASFTVAAWSTRDVGYESFAPGTLSVSAVRGEAMGRIELACTEPSGVVHSASLQ